MYTLIGRVNLLKLFEGIAIFVNMISRPKLNRGKLNCYSKTKTISLISAEKNPGLRIHRKLVKIFDKVNNVLVKYFN